MAGPSLPLLAWRNLWRNGRRTLLTLASVAFGLFLSLLMTVMQDGSFSDMIDTAARSYGGHVVLQHPEYQDTPTLSRSVADASALRALAQQDPAVSGTVERILGNVMLSTAGGATGTMFTAYDPAEEDRTTLTLLDAIVEGEPFTHADQPGIILGHKLARNLGVGLGDKVVTTMFDRNGDPVPTLARVTALVKTGSPGVDASLCLLPIDAVRASLGYGPHEAVRVGVFLHDNRQSAAVAARLAPGARDLGATSLPWSQVNPELSGFIALKVGGAIFMELLIGLLVAASIFNTLFVSVMERLREFGIQLAIGYAPRQLFALVLWESLFVAVTGVLAAAVLAVGPLYYLVLNGIDLSGTMGDSDNIDVAGVGVSMVLHGTLYWDHVFILVSAVVVATLLAGLYPAWRAGRVEPVDVIKLV